MILAVVLILVATGWRIAAAWEPSMANFAPLMALAFCGGVYFRNPRMWLIPFAALLLSDIYLDFIRPKSLHVSRDGSVTFDPEK